jgi:phage head maturation protease
MKAGEIDGLSTGFEVFETIEMALDDASTEFGIYIDPSKARDDGMIELFIRADLWEVSPVTFNAVPGALVDTVRKATPVSDFSGLAAALDRRERALKKLRFA